MSGFTTVGFFLISVIFGLIILTLWLRIALRYFRFSSLNPFSQLVCSITDPVINPISTLLKNINHINPRYDWISFAVLIFVEFLKIICLSLLSFHAIIPFKYLLIFVAADLIMQPLDLLFYGIIIRVIMSYANPGWQHPAADFLRVVTEPLLKIGRRIIPDISGFDFSPFVMMLILKVCTLFISGSLPLRLL